MSVPSDNTLVVAAALVPSPELSDGVISATAESCKSLASPVAPHTILGSECASQWPQTRMRTASPRGQRSLSTTNKSQSELVRAAVSSKTQTH